MDANTQLHRLKQRIELACQTANRSPNEVKLLAVSKTFPAQAVENFALAGQRAFGENYLQEAVKKITQLAESPDCPHLEWHFIGPIQSNKTREIAEYFDWVHSVDRLKIAQRLSSQRPADKPELQVLLQINTSGEESKSGVELHEAIDLAQVISDLPGLTLRGFMTIPSNTSDTELLRQEFLACKGLLDELKSKGLSQLDTLSMGMSGDLELAIECGSTCVRVGSALFGARSQ